MTEDRWFCLRTSAAPASFNMACDEWLLENAAAAGRPTLRFYAWSEPAASFGYSQRIAEVEAVTRLRPLVRRPTGGGLVPHDRDWTYSLVLPPAHAWHDLAAVESYRRVHEWIAGAFLLSGVPTILSPDCRREIPGQCFAGAERHDLLWQGRKIAGAAQRRNRSGLLVQGSVQPPDPALGRKAWEEAMLKAGTERYGIGWEGRVLGPAEVRDIGRLAAMKYACDSHNRRR